MPRKNAHPSEMKKDSRKGLQEPPVQSHGACAWWGMTDQNTTTRSLPHHRLLAYQAAVALLLAVKAANIRDAKLRDQGMRAAKSTCLNTAEGAGRVSRADQARAFAIARGEAVEAVAAVEIAALCDEADADAVPRCVAAADRVVALLTGLVR